MLEFLFNKVAGLKACNFIKNRLQHRCFPIKFTNFLRTPFFTEHFRWLLLKIMNSNNYLRVLPTFATRQFHQFFYKNSLMILPSASTIVEHFYLLKIAAILETRTIYFKQEPHFLIDQLRTYLIFVLRCIKSIFFNQSGNQSSLYKKHKYILSKQQILF